ncbi:MAG: FAD-binding oxidoreductase [Anaerolineaceae bacterium]|nr:FAD-binding oxidoreductase [Anaerolineaceae bacterium]|tara:strand:+ start:40384 stop:41778 length:1395 start_codon:yes stop_codon:yes gene_type:complete
MFSDFVDELSKMLTRDQILTAKSELIPYESDGLTAFKALPRAVVLPEQQSEVVDIVQLCHRYSVPFVARGSGTSLSGGSLPNTDGIVIGLNRLNRILSLDIEQRIAVVESGVINKNVSDAARSYGLYYAPDPSSQGVCTIGGNVAFNSGGAHCLKYGMTSNHVMGIKAVLPDGNLVELGGSSLENVGPDLVGLFVGSEGLLGIALEITLRLLPIPEAYRTVLAAYPSMELAGDAVAAIVASGLLPGAMEIMDNLTVRAVEEFVNGGYPIDAGAVLIVELEGESSAVEEEFVNLQEIVSKSGAYNVRSARNEIERSLIWKGRKGAFGALGKISPAYIVQDGVVPRNQLGAALAEIDSLSQEYGVRVANVFHAGDGNLHPNVLFDNKEDGMLEKAEAVASEIVKMCVRRGGAITGEHGVGMEKRHLMTDMFSDQDINQMLKLTNEFDPKGIANAGKMFPVDRLPGI